MFAEHRRQLVADHFHDLLVGRKLQHHLAADGLRADVGKQLISYADVDVAFEQRFANFGQRRVQMLIRELALPAQILERPLQLFCEVLKHGSCKCLASSLLKNSRTGATLRIQQLCTKYYLRRK